MSIVKSEPLKMKLSLKKETLRIIDDSQLDLLDEVVGGLISGCGCSGCQGTGCGTTQAN
ncbi:MAG: hypothetical protein ACJ8AT_37700 [Hyalangium sp.]|uniref:hypothetical protein n=1 Tax=Hyalangium sp. TaxID=2028555 RepID=UPI00389AB83C